MPIYLQHGNLIDYVPPTDTSTEDVVFMGGLVGIPQAFIPAGELGALSVDGVYMFTKKDGVSVNLGEVVKYCGTTKLAQDSNADLTLGVAVADAEADSLGVKVKINSVLPTDGGGGGGSGEVALCGASGLYFDDGEVAIRFCGNSAINADTNGVYLAVCGDSGLYIQDGELVASGGGGGGGGGEIAVGCGLAFNDSGQLFVNIDNVRGLAFIGNDKKLVVNANGCGGIYTDVEGRLTLKVCTASGLSIDENGYLTYTG